MTWADWLPALSTSTVLTAAGFLAGTYYKARVEKSIQYKLDQKLEEFKAKLRKDEETSRANQRSRDDQIAALRSGALSGMANRHAALDKRRLEAVEKLWSAVIDSAPLKFASKMVASIKMEYAIDAAAKQDEEGRKLRQFADVIWESSGLDKIKPRESPDTERPFLPPITWALFSAYRQVLGYPGIQLATMRSGVGQKLLADPKAMLDLVKSALPHQAELIEKRGTEIFPYLVEELEERLLAEIMASLDGSTADNKSIEQAADILKAVDKVAASTEPKPEIPDLPGLRH